MWKPSVTPSQVLAHSQGPWDKHKYVKIVNGKYFYPNGYEDGRTVSDLKGNAAKTANREQEKGEKRTKLEQSKKEVKEEKKPEPKFVEEDRKAKEEAEKKKAEEAAEKEKNKKTTEDSDSKKKKGSGSSKSKKDKKSDEEKEKEKKKKGSKKKGSSKKSSSSKSGSSKGSKGSSSKKSYADEILKKRREEQRQKEKARRMRLNKAMGREYLNHSAIWSPTPSSDELWHHGIQGQKWGKKNGPPYPLDQSQKSQAERKYRTDKGYNKNQNEQPKRKPARGKFTYSPVFGIGYQRGQRNSEVMSNKELERRINRKQLEQRYNELEDAQVKRGRNEVMGYIKDYTLIAGSALTTAKLLKLAGLIA